VTVPNDGCLHRLVVHWPVRRLGCWRSRRRVYVCRRRFGMSRAGELLGMKLLVGSSGRCSLRLCGDRLPCASGSDRGKEQEREPGAERNRVTRGAGLRVSGSRANGLRIGEDMHWIQLFRPANEARQRQSFTAPLD
jgi:hypothetical protein